MKNYKIINNKWTGIKDVSKFTKPPVVLYEFINGELIPYGLGYYK